MEIGRASARPSWTLPRGSARVSAQDSYRTYNTCKYERSEYLQWGVAPLPRGGRPGAGDRHDEADQPGADDRPGVADRLDDGPNGILDVEAPKAPRHIQNSMLRCRRHLDS